MGTSGRCLRPDEAQRDHRHFFEVHYASPVRQSGCDWRYEQDLESHSNRPLDFGQVKKIKADSGLQAYGASSVNIDAFGQIRIGAYN